MNPHLYEIYKWINSLSGIWLFPLVLLAGVMWGRGKKSKGVLLYCLYILLTVVDTLIYWQAMELIR